jgi:hypothetical protein
MTMPSSGPISLGQANTELGFSATALITMNDAALRTLAGVGGSGTTWSMNSLYGKSAVTISLSSVTSNEPFDATPFAGGEPSTAELNFASNGTWSATLEASASKSGNWATPTTTSIGAGYWIRFTRTFFSGGAGNSATGSTGWLQLNTTQGIFVSRTSGFGVTTADFTIEISTNSSGTNIVATASLITLTASMT